MSRWPLQLSAQRAHACFPAARRACARRRLKGTKTGAHLPRCPAAEAPTEEQIGGRDYRGPFNDLLCAMLAGQHLTRPPGKKALHLRRIFKELEAEAERFEDFLDDAAERQVWTVAVGGPEAQGQESATS